MKKKGKKETKGEMPARGRRKIRWNSIVLVSRFEMTHSAETSVDSQIITEKENIQRAMR